MKKKKLVKLLGILVLSTMLIACLTCCATPKNEQHITIDNANFVFEKIAEKAVPSTVRIICGNSAGSGVIVTSDGYIVTNDHVVEGNATAEIYMAPEYVNGWTSWIGTAKVIGEIQDGSKYANAMDLALLKLDSVSNDFTPVEFSTEEAKYGEYGMVVGNPDNIGILCSTAMVASPSIEQKHPKGYYANYIALDCSVNAGNSGGGFYNSEGKLLGIVTLRAGDDTLNNSNIVFGIGFAIPANDVVAYLQRYNLKLSY